MGLGEGSDMAQEEVAVFTIGNRRVEEKTTMEIEVLETLKLNF